MSNRKVRGFRACTYEVYTDYSAGLKGWGGFVEDRQGFRALPTTYASQLEADAAAAELIESLVA